MVSQPCILVVDDEADNFDVIEILLFQDGYQLNYAHSGATALNRLDRLKPDLILLDVMMPGLSGIEVCHQIKTHAEWQHIPVIIVTALDSKEDLVRCLEAGADDFISKPINGLELRARVRSMLRIKQQYDALKATMKLRQDMSDMVVHDLRNPLTGILLAAGILQMTPLTPKQLEKTEQIMASAQQLESLVNSLLVMAKLESGKLMITPEPINFNQLVSKVSARFEAIALQRKIQILTHFPEPQTLYLDANLTRRVLENLISNALKFSPEHSIVHIVVDYPEKNTIQIKVIDQGLGIKDDLKQCIFEKYEIGTVIRDVHQTGLGLAFCKMAVEAQSGTIEVADNNPKGAIFTVNLKSQELAIGC
ncbi:hybrid sensor histidine kinase/response regulator [Almyronema epifaneia]|uniref:histidine kinase n=1 Tax=Almyronema epifaneia S1 TaxID=2991925 RepID=A0ABW6IAT2_9CYAN